MVNAASTVHSAQKPALPDQSGGRPRDRDILSAREAQFRYVWDWYAKTGLDYGDRKNGIAIRGAKGKRACVMRISLRSLCNCKRIMPESCPEIGCEAFPSAIDLRVKLLAGSAGLLA